MKITEFIRGDELLRGIREASTLADPNARPYESATLSIEDIPIDACRPTQLYVVDELVAQQGVLRRKAKKSLGLDTLHLEGGAIVKCKANKSLMLPPIVESYPGEGLMLLDGTHRTFLAKSLGLNSMRCICIQGVPDEYALHHRRLPNEWGEIVRFPTVDDLRRAREEGFVHRREGNGTEPDKYYRDFSNLTSRSKDDRRP